MKTSTFPRVVAAVASVVLTLVLFDSVAGLGAPRSAQVAITVPAIVVEA